jgi:hypothetical protein
MNRLGSLRIVLAAAACLVLALILAPGCMKTSSSKPKGSETTVGPKTDPWDGLAKRLRKENDAASLKTAFASFASDLSGREDVPKPPELTPEAEKALAALVPLAPADLASIRLGVYGGLDPTYLAECMYLRDAARSLDPTTLPPPDLARAGFAWVCRQVYLNPWLLEVQRGVFEGTAVPPTAVLRRGYGSGLERAYVFLALLQQMGIDGCLIGPPEAANLPAAFVAKGPDGKALTGSPRGPFWAVGARVGPDILLFDPWRGLPFPSQVAGAVGTFAQLKTATDALKPWFDDKSWGVTPDDAKKATVFLAVPVTSLAPRMALLEEKTRAELGARLSVDPAALRERFVAPVSTGAGVPAGDVKFWNPPGDRYAFGRALATFTPAEDGGADRGESSRRYMDLYLQAMLPPTLLRLPPEIKTQAARERLFLLGVGQYLTAYYTSPTPRERLQRGQYQDAMQYLTNKQDFYALGLERVRANTSANAENLLIWCKAVDEVYAMLHQAKYPDDRQTQSLPDSDPGVAAAKSRVEDFWKSSALPATVIIDQATAGVGLAEATFLLAMAKHEAAERQQVRAERASGADAVSAKAAAGAAWREAASMWQTCLERLAAVPEFPGRTEHAKALAARAKSLAAPE